MIFIVFSTSVGVDPNKTVVCLTERIEMAHFLVELLNGQSIDKTYTFEPWCTVEKY